MKHLISLKETIQRLIDWFYIPFRKLIPHETFRYAVCGGSNWVLDNFLYFITYNFILRKNIVNLKIVAISPYQAAYMMVFPITFVIGFMLAKYITFSQSELRGRVQLMRYGFTVVVCFLLNYILIKLFVEECGFYPTPSKILASVLVVVYSYFSNKHYTFKTEPSNIHR